MVNEIHKNYEYEAEKAAEVLSGSKSIAVLTGAGISAESGVPTFRGKDGIWNGRDAMKLATPQAFATEPETVWAFYNWRRNLLSSCRPNAAHFALAELEKAKTDFTLITQNVDGLHIKAGCSKVYEIHGNLWRQKCSSCGEITFDDRSCVPYPPLCSHCGKILRPDVVWFGETLDPVLISSAEQACANSDVLLVIGTSSIVYPAAMLAPLARQTGAKVIEININSTPDTNNCDIILRGRAGDIVPEIVNRTLEIS